MGTISHFTHSSEESRNFQRWSAVLDWLYLTHRNQEMCLLLTVGQKALSDFPNEMLMWKSEKDGRESLVWHWLVPNTSLLTTHHFWGHTWECQGLWRKQQVRKKLPKEQFTKPQRDDKPDSFPFVSSHYSLQFC